MGANISLLVSTIKLSLIFFLLTPCYLACLVRGGFLPSTFFERPQKINPSCFPTYILMRFEKLSSLLTRFSELVILINRFDLHWPLQNTWAYKKPVKQIWYVKHTIYTFMYNYVQLCNMYNYVHFPSIYLLIVKF